MGWKPLTSIDDSGFQGFLARSLGEPSILSYLSYLRRVERTLGTRLGGDPLAESDIGAILLRLSRSGFPQSSVRNCGSALRSFAEYAAQRGTASPDPPDPPKRLLVAKKADVTIQPAQAIAEPPVADWPGQPTAALLRAYGEILEELRARSIVRTGNSPVGDYGEHLFAHAFGWKLQPNNVASYDALGSDNLRYQIKARRLTSHNGSRQLSAIRKLDDRAFDFLAAVLFDARLAVEKAVIIPFDVVKSHATWTEHTNSWRVLLDARLCARPEVADVTSVVRAAQDSI